MLRRICVSTSLSSANFVPCLLYQNNCDIFLDRFRPCAISVSGIFCLFITFSVCLEFRILKPSIEFRTLPRVPLFIRAHSTLKRGRADVTGLAFNLPKLSCLSPSEISFGCLNFSEYEGALFVFAVSLDKFGIAKELHKLGCN
jgi:hypothetical protein